MERQRGQIHRLNERAHRFFGFGAAILPIIVTVATKDTTTAMKIALIVAIPLFGPIALYAAVAWDLTTWRDDPDLDVLWEHYRKDTEEHFRYQVILNRLDAIRENDQKIAAKLRKVKWAHRWLFCGIVYTGALVTIRLLQ